MGFRRLLCFLILCAVPAHVFASYEEAMALDEKDPKRTWLLQKSIEAYNNVKRGSDAWGEALYARAFAYAALGQYGDSLGSLYSLTHPYFSGGSYPEADWLKAFNYWQTCHFDKAKQALEQFQSSQKGKSLQGTLLSLEIKTSEIRALEKGEWPYVKVSKEKAERKLVDDKTQFWSGTTKERWLDELGYEHVFIPSVCENLPKADASVDLLKESDRRRAEAISDIETLLPQIEENKKAELTFRLSELYWERYRYAYTEEYQQYDVDSQKTKDLVLSDYLKESLLFREKAKALSLQILKDYENYERLDEVLYSLAFLEHELGDKESSFLHYSRLINQFKQSSYLADAYLALGEQAFSNNQKEEAEVFYQKAYELGLEKNRSATSLYALYKLAWCDLNQQKLSSALSRFKQVVLLSEASGLNQGSIQLKEEALGDMIRVYAQLLDVEGAYAYYLETAGAQHVTEWLEKLARVLERQGAYEREIDVYRLLVAFNPKPEALVSYRVSILKSLGQLGRREGLANAADELMAVCQDTCQEGKEVLKNLAQRYHRFSNEHKSKEDQTLAIHLYNAYLKMFSDDKESYKIRFFLAEIQWDIGDFQQAFETYEKVFKQNPEGEFAKNSASNAVLSARMILSSLDSKKEWAQLEETVQDFRKKNFLLQDVIFSKTLEKLEEGASFNRILLESEQGVLEPQKAAFLFRQWAERYPQSEFAYLALYNAATFSSKAHQDEDVAKDAKNLLENYSAQIKADKEKGASIHQDALFWLAESYERQGDPAPSLCLELAPFLKKRSSLLGAFCAFQSLQGEWESYKTIPLQGSIKKLSKQIQIKKSKMEGLKKKYAAILDWKNTKWGMAALYRVAEIQLDYVRALRGIPDPKKLSPEALAVFRSELDNIVFPIEEDAISTLQAVLEKASASGEDSVVAEKAKEQLNRLVPATG